MWLRWASQCFSDCNDCWRHDVHHRNKVEVQAWNWFIITTNVHTHNHHNHASLTPFWLLQDLRWTYPNTIDGSNSVNAAVLALAQGAASSNFSESCVSQRVLYQRIYSDSQLKKTLSRINQIINIDSLKSIFDSYSNSCLIFHVSS